MGDSVSLAALSDRSREATREAQEADVQSHNETRRRGIAADFERWQYHNRRGPGSPVLGLGAAHPEAVVDRTDGHEALLTVATLDDGRGVIPDLVQ